MKDIRPWKKTGFLVFAAALGGIISVPGTGLLTARATVAVQASPVTEYDEAALASFADDTLEYWEIPGLVERYNSAYQKQLDQFYYNPGSSTGLTKDQLLSVAETLRQEAETLADTAEDEKDSITKQEYEEYRNNVRILGQGKGSGGRGQRPVCLGGFGPKGPADLKKQHSEDCERHDAGP